MSDRSPRYPNTDLKDAIDSVEKIFKEDRQNPIDRLVAAKHMGYSSLSGASDKAIAALMHYGLLEKSAKGEVSVTRLAVDILHPETRADRASALFTAANKPKVFTSINNKFPGGHFSEESLKSYLIREGYGDSAIPLIIKIYNLNRQFLRLEEALEGGGLGDKESGESAVPLKPEVETMPTILQPTFQAVERAQPPVIQGFAMTTADSENDIKVLLDGSHLRVSAYVDLKGAKRLLKALKANMALLEDDDDSEDTDD